ncbi:MAG: pyridoxal phosphate-dependent aminotransferase family protein [Archangiaceae bacterium]|nr:pyridoxal phosphate-dependent aminotransferase family protein [Archangiaceae bacterium]
MKELIDRLKRGQPERVLAARSQVPAVDAMPGQGEVELSGRRAVNFGTDDALGLATDSRVKEAAAAAVRRYGTQGHASQVLTRDLEERLAAFLGRERVRVSGDPAALLSPFASVTSSVLSDARHHVGLDRLLPRAHPAMGDLLALEGAIAAAEPPVLLVAAGIHASEGDLSPLPRLLELSTRSGATLLVDETRSLGVLGSTGAGAAEHLLGNEPGLVIAASLSGALASRGAFIAGPSELVDTLEASTLSPANAAAALKALELIQAEPQRRARLFDVTHRLLDGLRARGFDIGPTVTPRIPLWMGDESRAVRLGRALIENGVLCQIVALPRRARLLLTPQATQSDAQIDQALQIIERTARKLEMMPEPVGTELLPIDLARPGTSMLSSPCAEHWVATVAAAQPPPKAEPGPARDVAARLFDAVETLTWRAANVAPELRRLTALIPRRKR